MAIPLASRATKQTARKGAPDSDSRSVEREGVQAAARNIVKRGALASAPAPQASAFRVAAVVPPGCNKMRRLRRARRSVEPRDVRPWRRALARATASRRAYGPLRCTASQVPRYAGPPRLRRLNYDLRRAPRIHPHFAGNAIRGGLNQRFHEL